MNVWSEDCSADPQLQLSRSHCFAPHSLTIKLKLNSSRMRICGVQNSRLTFKLRSHRESRELWRFSLSFGFFSKIRHMSDPSKALHKSILWAINHSLIVIYDFQRICQQTKLTATITDQRDYSLFISINLAAIIFPHQPKLYAYVLDVRHPFFVGVFFREFGLSSALRREVFINVTASWSADMKSEMNARQSRPFSIHDNTCDDVQQLQTRALPSMHLASQSTAFMNCERHRNHFILSIIHVTSQHLLKA